MMELNENGQKVLKLLRNIPPDFTGAEEILVKEELSREEVSYIGYRYTSDCYEELLYNTDEVYDTVGAENIFGFYFYEPPELKEGLHSTYLLDVMKLLYRYGMDPCMEFKGSNVLGYLPHIPNEYVGADTLAYLFENGVDPKYITKEEGSLFDLIDFDVVYDMYEQYSRRRYDHLVHSWLVFIGYGALDGNKKNLVTFFYSGDYDEYIKLFRKHRNFTFGITNIPSRGDRYSISIFDRSYFEVARV